jgi:signal peptidase II
MTARRLALAVAAIIVAADQLTKWWAVAALSDGPVVLVDGFLQFRLVRNPGGAFGSLPGAGPLIALAAVAAVVVIVLIVRRLEGRWETAAMGLVLGGAIGNLIDRAVRGPGLLDGKVIDFVDFDFFPTFNVADSAITVGAILAVLVALRAEHT